MAVGVAGGVAVGVAVGVAGGVAVGVAGGVAVGVAVGVAGGVAFGVAGGVAGGVAVGVAVGVAGGVAFGVALGVAFGVAGGVAGGVAVGVAFGVAFAVAFPLMFWATYFRLITYPFDMLLSLSTYRIACRRPPSCVSDVEVASIAWNEVIWLPLPFATRLLALVVRQDRAAGSHAVAFVVAERRLQRRVAQQALAEALIEDLATASVEDIAHVTRSLSWTSDARWICQAPCRKSCHDSIAWHNTPSNSSICRAPIGGGRRSSEHWRKSNRSNAAWSAAGNAWRRGFCGKPIRGRPRWTRQPRPWGFRRRAANP